MVVVLICASLFMGSFVLGYLPFFIKMDSTNISVVSAGILVGAGLGVILPESLESMSNKEYVGILLLSGFIVMMAADVLLHKEHKYEVMDITIHDRTSSNGDGITLGLILHALADGVALGAACASDQVALEISIFIAILLHKGPTAFALVSLLIKQGVPRTKVRNSLLLFSCASPFATFATYLFLLVSQVQSQWIGSILIFSAGTFIYVATLHVIPGILPANNQIDRKTFMLLLLGILVPVLVDVTIPHTH
eukprot:NODE_194_length_15414_cov_0.324127.p9 type:complete len:251 gc:universal NODE_194_length_15414_cov_0.324127:12829-13581(+)